MTGDPAWPFGELPLGHFALIQADPPWSFRTRSPKGWGKSAQRHYSTMTLEQIAALPVARLAARDCALALWATWPMLDQALRVMSAWGFAYRTGLPWAKQSPTGASWAFGTGYILRGASEPLLIGTRGAPRPLSRGERGLIVAPQRGHSRKPDEAHEKLARLYPGPRLELFARQSRPGWTVWGDQAGLFDTAPEEKAA